MTMAYILVVNPLILSDAGMDRGAVFTATALSSILAIVIMAFGANLPFALAPGMGLNAFFVYTVFAMVPAAATAPALILVGVFMMSPIKEVEPDDPTEAIPAFLTMVMMP